eukprot:CAMPEP_0173392976 /NCGR_PEP_ID=MMETSP1356-20130122/21843_1 /TAXON_ID=77927 ORGANISM="Hemiselmis virescens, Strain PCC157" /NCGR_SAMPLE_ID=MMETSP1356 /ASSEMBLY_ACC=CAM_ASM_000847 /LENGTH=40 /DNA_ID= /DNA_START= /DNA_END= /DNA_ORIENTATION=
MAGHHSGDEHQAGAAAPRLELNLQPISADDMHQRLNFGMG